MKTLRVLFETDERKITARHEKTSNKAEIRLYWRDKWVEHAILRFRSLEDMERYVGRISEEALDKALRVEREKWKAHTRKMDANNRHRKYQRVSRWAD